MLPKRDEIPEHGTSRDKLNTWIVALFRDEQFGGALAIASRLPFGIGSTVGELLALAKTAQPEQIDQLIDQLIDDLRSLKSDTFEIEAA